MHESIEVQGNAYCFLIVAYCYPGCCYGRMVPSGQIVNQQYYEQVLEKLYECVKKRSALNSEVL